MNHHKNHGHPRIHTMPPPGRGQHTTSAKIPHHGHTGMALTPTWNHRIPIDARKHIQTSPHTILIITKTGACGVDRQCHRGLPPLATRKIIIQEECDEDRKVGKCKKWTGNGFYGSILRVVGRGRSWNLGDTGIMSQRRRWKARARTMMFH